MDFSSATRSLTSLSRRQPPLPPNVVSLSRTLLQLLEESNASSDNYGGAVLQMIGYGMAPTADEGNDKKVRWEPLAVGLYLANDYLERLCAASLSAGDAKRRGGGGVSDGVYAEGPRVPNLTPQAPPDDAPGSSATGGSGTGSSGSGGSSGGGESSSVDLTETVDFCATLLDHCQTNLEHAEPRVRTLVAKTVGSHARYGLTLPPPALDARTALSDQRRALYRRIIGSLRTQLELGRDTSGAKSKASTGALDDTTGWRAVETNLHALASYAHGCGGTYVDEEGGALGGGVGEGTLLGAVRYCSITHVNRHVRAAGVAVLEQLVGSVVSNGKDESMGMLTDPESSLRSVLVDVLKVTLADNWSQVRMAGSVLNRTLLVALLDHGDRTTVTDLYPILLPRMCLNRFYLAQGVKLYSHETWRLVFGRGGSGEGSSSGMQAISDNAGAVCRYYVKMCDADNHAVREAACQAVAELAQKLGAHPAYADSLSPYVPMLLQALIMCFHDESWPVRDEACLACGTFCRAYPEECRPELDTLFSRWVEQLTDQIWSVREDAAVALGDAIVAYGAEMFAKVLDVVRTNLSSAKDQPAMSREEHAKRQNDIDAHTDSQLYSCGSLAPKLRKGGAGRIGCSSCDVTREKAPWEATDGCIYLLRELCVRCCESGPGNTTEGDAAAVGVTLSDETLLPLLTELADVCRVRHFPQADDLRATLWRQLPVMAKALGKQRFKRNYLHLFLDLLSANLDADRSGSGASQLSVHAAGQCAEELAALVGIGIFRGRLEEEWQKEAFDKAMEERRAAGPGPGLGAAAGGGFSPFGPTGLIPGGGAGIGGGGGGGMAPTAPVGGGVPPPAGAAFPTSTPPLPSQSRVPGSGFEDTL